MTLDNDDFFDNWTDEAARERAKLHVKEIYETHKQMKLESIKTSVEYGKWTLASLLFLHSGALYLLTQMGLEPKLVIKQIGAYHFTGITCTLVSGFFAYLNFGFLSRHYDKYTNPAIMYRHSAWPNLDDAKFDPIGATMWLSILSGILSAAMLVFSSVDIMRLIN
jgi:hypothetical protein